MSGHVDHSSPTAESVSPQKLIPAVSVVAVVVLMVFAVAVFVFLRTYKRRQQRGEQLVSNWLGASNFDDRTTWRDMDFESSARSGKLSMASSRFHKGSWFAGRNRSIIESPELAAHRPRSWNSKNSCRYALHRRIADVELGYNFDDAAPTSMHTVEVALAVAPNTHASAGGSKLERMTGNQLSNALYEDCTGGSQRRLIDEPLVRDRETKIFGYPWINTNISYIPRHRRDNSLETSVSPTTIGDFEFPPNSPTSFNEATALAPPPPPASAAQIAATYPNIAALTQANVTVHGNILPKRHSGLSSFLVQGQRQKKEHIASQFSPTKREWLRLAHNSTGSSTRHGSATNNLAAPLSAAFGGFTGLDRVDSKGSRASRTSSISTFRFGMVGEDPPPLPSPTAVERHSWSGRSVLLLDDEPRNSGGGRPTGVLPSPINLSGWVPSPPPDPEGCSDKSESLSISKISVCSQPSFVSSLYTMSGGADGGLSPTPARRPPLTIDNPSIHSQARSGMSVLEMELELEMEMRNIRERAHRASQERKLRRRQKEEEEDDDEYQPEKVNFVFL